MAYFLALKAGVTGTVLAKKDMCFHLNPWFQQSTGFSFYLSVASFPTSGIKTLTKMQMAKLVASVIPGLKKN